MPNRARPTKEMDSRPDRSDEFIDTTEHTNGRGWVAFKTIEETVFEYVRFIGDDANTTLSATYPANYTKLGNFDKVKLTSGSIEAYRRG